MVGPNLILHFTLDYRYRRLEVEADFSQVEAVELLVVLLHLSRVGVEVPPRLEVAEGATVMLSRGDLRWRPRTLLLQVSFQPLTCVCIV